MDNREVRAWLGGLEKNLPDHVYDLWEGDPAQGGSVHCEPDFAGTIATWSNSDTEENYRKNEERILRQTVYTDRSFAYQVNTCGYRCDQFPPQARRGPNDVRIVFIGCSVTYGVGVPVEDCWPHMVISQMRQEFPDLYLPYINLARGGKSADWCARLIWNWVIHGNPLDYLVVLLPEASRAELIMSEESSVDFLANFTRWERKRTLEELSAVTAYDAEFANNPMWLRYHWQRALAMIAMSVRAARPRSNTQSFPLNWRWSSWWLPSTFRSMSNGLFSQTALRDGFYCGHVEVPDEDLTDRNLVGRDLIHPGKAQHQLFANLVVPEVRTFLVKWKGSNS